MRAKTGLAKWILCSLVAGASAAACGDGKGGSGTNAETACVGTPVACGLLSASTCALAAGCATGACNGTVASCAGFTTDTECLLQQGCAPNGSSACGGIALACPALSTDSECRAQRGCSWQAGCSGHAAACEALNATACVAQPGCHLGTSSATDGGTAPDTSAPPPRDCEDAGVPTQLLIDDMEDQTPGIVSSVAYGTWYVYNDQTVGGHMTPAPGMPFTMEPIPGGRCASEYAMRMSGTGLSQWGAGMGFDFGYGGTNASGQVLRIPVDARAYAGVRLWARVGQATTTRATFSISAGTCPPPDGGPGGGDAGDDGSATRAPSDCTLGYAKSLVLTTDWVRYDLAFDEFLSNPGRLSIPRDQIYSFQFLVAPSTTFDLWIDDISWLPAP
jgi:hypothetical protein